jgi:heme oxygenase
MQSELNASRSPRSPTRMQRLREATRVEHARAEESLPLLKPSLTLATYIRVLEAFYGFYEPLEPRVARALAASASGKPLAGRDRKVALLLADLRALGKTQADIDALARCGDLPHVASASRAAGALYVVEGATLGGQVITRHLRATLGARVSDGTAFFSGYGDMTGPMWTRFSRHVDASTDLDTEALVDAAAETFEKFLAWLHLALGAS